MAVVFGVKESDSRMKVTWIHYKPDHPKYKITSEKKKEGVKIENIPEKETPEGKKAVGFVNPETKEFWWEYVDRPKEPMEVLDERINSLEKATGSGGKKPERGLAYRLDDLEERIEALEEKVK